MYRGNLQTLIDEKRYNLYFVILTPEYATIPCNPSKLEVLAAENEEDFKNLMAEAKKIRAAETCVMMNLDMIKEKDYIFSKKD